MAEVLASHPPTGDGSPARFPLHLWQVETALLTAVVTVWCCTLGVVPAVLALMGAKHVLVSILLIGRDGDGRREVGGP